MDAVTKTVIHTRKGQELNMSTFKPPVEGANILLLEIVVLQVFDIGRVRDRAGGRMCLDILRLCGHTVKLLRSCTMLYYNACRTPDSFNAKVAEAWK